MEADTPQLTCKNLFMWFLTLLPLTCLLCTQSQHSSNEAPVHSLYFDLVLFLITSYLFYLFAFVWNPAINFLNCLSLTRVMGGRGHTSTEQTHQHTHAHTLSQSGQSNTSGSSNTHAFGLWEETGAPIGNPCRCLVSPCKLHPERTPSGQESNPGAS